MPLILTARAESITVTKPEPDPFVIVVLVTDPSGEPVTGLQAKDFRVRKLGLPPAEVTIAQLSELAQNPNYAQLLGIYQFTTSYPVAAKGSYVFSVQATKSSSGKGIKAVSKGTTLVSLIVV